MDQPAGADVRCSAVVFRGPEVLLVRRVRDRHDDWVLPGGTPRPGEGMAACAGRETLEETGLAVQPNRIAFVLETRGRRAGVHRLDLRPPIAGHLRGLHARGTARTAAYLGNLWRPRGPDDALPTPLEFTDEQTAPEMS
jgi:8-oxo-dGTP diphosphatase